MNEQALLSRKIERPESLFVQQEPQQRLQEDGIYINLIVKDKSQIILSCLIQDFKIILTVATLQKLAQTLLAFKKIGSDFKTHKIQLQKGNLENIIKTLSTINDLNSQTCLPEDQALQLKLFFNLAFAKGIDPLLCQDLFITLSQQALQIVEARLAKSETASMSQKIKDLVEKIKQRRREQKARQKIDHNSEAATEKRGIADRVYAVLQGIRLDFKWKNFNVWVPLQAAKQETQIFKVSLDSESSYQMKQRSDKKNLKFKEYENSFTYQVNHCLVSLIVLDHFEDSHPLADHLQDASSAILSSQELSFTTLSTILDQRKVSLRFHRMTSELSRLTQTTFTLEMKPIAVNISYKNIDFIINLVGQLGKTMSLLNRLGKKKMKKEQANTTETVDLGVIEGSKRRRVNRREIIKTIKELKGKIAEVKFQRYDPQTRSWEDKVGLHIKCAQFSLSLIDDTNTDALLSLVTTSISNLALDINLNKTKDDAGSFILKKLGFSPAHKDFLSLKLSSSTAITYHNYRSQSPEPFIEPHSLRLLIRKASPQSSLKVHFEIPEMVNVNLTYGMAFTLRAIKDRIREGLRQAVVSHRVREGQSVTNEDLESHAFWKNSFFMGSGGSQLSDRMDIEELQGGFIFSNTTGQDVWMQIHESKDLERNGSEAATSQRSMTMADLDTSSVSSSVISFNEWQLNGKDPQQRRIISNEKLYSFQKEIQAKSIRARGLIQDPLSLDIQIEGITLIEKVPIERLGVYSFKAFIDLVQSESPSSQIAKAKKAQKKRKMFPLIKRLMKDEKQFTQPVGILVSIGLEGVQKNVMVSSLLEFVNLHEREAVSIFIVQESETDLNKPMQNYSLAPNSTFRVPLSWIYGPEPLNLYVETKSGPQLLFKNLSETFSHCYIKSSLDSKSSKLFQFYSGNFSAVNVNSFKCQTAISLEDSNPPQYVVSFDSPLKVTNLNFQRIILRNEKNEVIESITPKGQAKIDQLDFSQKDNLPFIHWTVFDFEQKLELQMRTIGFNPKKRAKNEPTEETLTRGSIIQSLVFDVKKVLIPSSINGQADVEDPYSGRERLFAVSSTFAVFIYPKAMIINKTVLGLEVEGQYISGNKTVYMQEISKCKLSLATQGYKEDSFSTKNLGLTLSLSLERDHKQNISSFTQPLFNNYLPPKLELSVQAEKAPYPFNKTLLITVMPKHLIINTLSDIVYLYQDSQLAKALEPNETLHFDFLSDTSKRLSISESPISSRPNDRSTDFSLDFLDTFVISYPSQPLDEVELSVISSNQSSWFLPSRENGYQRFVQVTITSKNDASMLIVFSDPSQPEIEVVNRSSEDLQIGQVKDKFVKQTFSAKGKEEAIDMVIGKLQTVKAGSKIPFSWPNREVEKMSLGGAFCTGGIFEIDLEKVNIEQELKVATGDQKKQLYYKVILRANQKIVIISETACEESDISRQSLKAQILSDLFTKRLNSQVEFAVRVKGMSMNFINKVPKEILLVSVVGTEIRLSSFMEFTEEKGHHIYEKGILIDYQLRHMQIDNMSSIGLPVVFAPIKPYHHPARQIQDEEEDINQQDESPPFFDLHIQTSQSSKVIKLISLTQQPSSLNVESSSILACIGFFEDLAKILIKNRQPIALITDETIDHGIDKVCPKLKPELGVFITQQSNKESRICIEKLYISKIKQLVTLKIDKNSLALDFKRNGKKAIPIELLFKMVENFSSISNSQFKFKELIMENVNEPRQDLIKSIVKGYIKQSVKQAYTLIGGQDIIGNPQNFARRIRTGLKDQGMHGLVKGTVSGGLESASKISGGLYQIVKNAGTGKSKNEVIQESRPENVKQGFAMGMAGFKQEIQEGFKGLINKPKEMRKEHGARGFIKGLRQGVRGAILAPVAATLKAAQNIQMGAANGTQSIGKSPQEISFIDTSSPYSRFRPPRSLTASRSVLLPYDLKFSLIQFSVSQIKHSKYTQNSSILYVTALPFTSQHGDFLSDDPHSSILVVLEKGVLYLSIDQVGPERGRASLLFKTKFKSVASFEAYRLEKSENNKREEGHRLVIQTKKKKSYTLFSYEEESFEYVTSFFKRAALERQQEPLQNNQGK